MKKEKTYFVSIETCQNCPVAIIKVRALSTKEAEQKAMRAYVENIECLRVSTYAKKYVKEQIENGEILYDEDGSETDLD